MITSGSALFGPTSTLIAVEHAARERGLFVSVATVLEFTAEAVRLALEHFMSQGVDGAVVIAAQDDAIAAVRSFDAPVSRWSWSARATCRRGRAPGLGEPLPAAPGSRPGTSSTSGTRGSCTSPARRTGSRAASECAAGADELVAAGLAADRGDPGDWSADRGYQVGPRAGRPARCRRRSSRPTTSSRSACSTRSPRRGVRVPQDVSVVGFDDIAGSAHFSPPLTTVRQEFADLGRACLSVLHGAIAGEP